MPPSMEIVEPKQLIVEGNDDVRILRSLGSHLNISNLEIRPYGGVDNMRTFLRTLSALPAFRLVQSLAIVADANSDRSMRETRIRSALSDMNLPTPPSALEVASNDHLRVAYLVVPHDTEGSMIEDVCLDSVSDDPAIECMDRYFQCVEKVDTPGPRQVWISKARAHAFLASRDRPDLRIGEAADRGIWQFEHEAFNPLKDLSRCSEPNDAHRGAV